jgi:hypothetical protein
MSWLFLVFATAAEPTLPVLDDGWERPFEYKYGLLYSDTAGHMTGYHDLLRGLSHVPATAAVDRDFFTGTYFVYGGYLVAGAGLITTAVGMGVYGFRKFDYDTSGGRRPNLALALIPGLLITGGSGGLIYVGLNKRLRARQMMAEVANQNRLSERPTDVVDPRLR